MAIRIETVSPGDTTRFWPIEAEDTSTVGLAWPSPVLRNMFLIGPQDPSNAVNKTVGLFACMKPEVFCTTEKSFELIACLS